MVSSDPHRGGPSHPEQPALGRDLPVSRAPPPPASVEPAQALEPTQPLGPWLPFAEGPWEGAVWEPANTMPAPTSARTLAGLASAVVHLTLMIVLALLVSVRSSDRRLDLQAEFVCAEELDEPLEFHLPLGGNDTGVTEEPALTPDSSPPMEQLLAVPWDVDLVLDERTLPGAQPTTADGGAGDGGAGDGDGTIGAKLANYWRAAARAGLQTRQSCSVDPLAGNDFIAEAKLGGTHTVLAIDHYGKGRIAYYCDMTTVSTR